MPLIMRSFITTSGLLSALCIFICCAIVTPIKAIAIGEISTSPQNAMIREYFADHPLISAYARGLLIKGRHIDFTESISFPSQVKSYPDYYYFDQRKTKIREEDHLVLFPNPCGDFVVSYFNTIEEGHRGKLLLSDIQGKELDRINLNCLQNQFVINLSDYSNGNYIISLFVDDKLIYSRKLSKARK